MTMTVLRRVTGVVKTPPGWTPGICHHDAHAFRDGERVGLLFLDDDLASVMPCLHNTKDGQ